MLRSYRQILAGVSGWGLTVPVVLGQSVASNAAASAPATPPTTWQWSGSYGTWLEFDQLRTDDGQTFDKFYFFGRLVDLNVKDNDRFSANLNLRFEQLGEYGYLKDDHFVGHDVRVNSLKFDYKLTDQWSVSAGKFGTTPLSIFTEIGRLGVDLTHTLPNGGLLQSVRGKVFWADITPLSASFFGERPQRQRADGGLTNTATPSVGLDLAGQILGTATDAKNSNPVQWSVSIDHLQASKRDSNSNTIYSLALYQSIPLRPETTLDWSVGASYNTDLFGIKDCQQAGISARLQVTQKITDALDFKFITTEYFQRGDLFDHFNPSFEVGAKYKFDPQTSLEIRYRWFNFHNNGPASSEPIDDYIQHGIGLIFTRTF